MTTPKPRTRIEVLRLGHKADEQWRLASEDYLQPWEAVHGCRGELLAHIDHLQALYDAAWAECEAWRAAAKYATSPSAMCSIEELRRNAIAHHDALRNAAPDLLRAAEEGARMREPIEQIKITAPEAFSWALTPWPSPPQGVAVLPIERGDYLRAKECVEACDGIADPKKTIPMLHEAARMARNVLFLLQPEVAALGHRANEVRRRLDLALAGTPPAKNTIEDGHGSSWSLCGPGCSLAVVRPGKVQCNKDAPTCPEQNQ